MGIILCPQPATPGAVATVDAAVDAIQTDLGNPSARTNLKTIEALLGNPDVAGSTVWSAVAALQTDLGDPSARTNLKTIEAMLGNPDVAGNTVYQAVLDANTDIDAVQTDLGNPSARTNLKTIEAMLGNPDVAGNTLYQAVLDSSTGVSDIQTDIGNPSARTNLKSLEAMLGNPDVAGNTLYQAVLDANTDVDAIQTDLGNPSARTNSKTIEAMLGNPDTADKTVWNAVKYLMDTATGGLEVDTYDSMAYRIDEIEKHLHPQMTSAFPIAKYRQGAIRMTAATDTETVTIGALTYHILTALGSPGANTVHVKIQGSVPLTARKLVQAIGGYIDADNIAYGAGAAANAAATAHFTANRYYINATAIAAGSNIILIAKVAEAAAPTLSETGSGMTVTAFTRALYQRYLLNGNTTETTGDLQTLIPLNAVVEKYDAGMIVLEAISATGFVAELDLYYSTDESTYTLMAEGIKLARDTTTQGADRIQVPMHRVDAYAGLYAKARSDSGSDAATFDISLQYHTYAG